MKLSLAIVTAVTAMFLVDAAVAQSFNCRYAKKPDEVLICQDRYLSGLDEEMSGLYFNVRKYLSRGHRKALEAEQAAWLRSRMRCGYDYGCVEGHYLDRISELRRY
ncbi:MAG: DUF1311 domain-containing protein [Hyphomicrobiales bacterium]|nr:DUF1311 domain-containing protein [Hyphomicrobiales bacterium]